MLTPKKRNTRLPTGIRGGSPHRAQNRRGSCPTVYSGGGEDIQDAEALAEMQSAEQPTTASPRRH